MAIVRRGSSLEGAHVSLYVRQMKTPVGRLKIVGGENGLRAILWPDDDPARVKFEVEPRRSSIALFDAVELQLDEYFAGRRERFDLELDLKGTDFQRAVWRELERIGYGRTVTYGDIAKRVGRPTAVRAVGAAIGRNPISIIVPCHRVIGSNGQLTGFAGGLESKTRLLAIEKKPLLRVAKRL